MTKPIIKTPRGSIQLDSNGKASLTFDTSFQSKWQSRFSKAQVFVDSEVLRLSEPLIPLRTGVLIKSGILGTVPGQGFVEWLAPYSAYQYYSTREPGTDTGPQRGPFWFERLKKSHGDSILEGARRIAGQS